MRRILASWFGTGLILGRLRGSDTGSGTVGSLATLALVAALRPLGVQVHLAVALTVIVISIVVTEAYAHQGDPGWVVIDEAAGTLVATLGLGLAGIVAGFVVFRVTDIWKGTPGVGQAERLRGGWGITLDDVVAGMYGLAAGWIVQWLVS